MNLIYKGLLPKKKSTKSLPDPSSNDDSLNKGIVKGFSVNSIRTSPRSPYEAGKLNCNYNFGYFNDRKMIVFVRFGFIMIVILLVVWSVGLGELVKIDDAISFPNRFESFILFFILYLLKFFKTNLFLTNLRNGAEVKKMKCRGDFVLTKEYDSQFMNAFDDFEILKLEIGILFFDFF